MTMNEELEPSPYDEELNARLRGETGEKDHAAFLDVNLARLIAEASTAGAPVEVVRVALQKAIDSLH